MTKLPSSQKTSNDKLETINAQRGILKKFNQKYFN
jgi:hypothetical protein